MSRRRSRIAPYYRGESPSKRHQRRLQCNVKRAAIMEAWCESVGIRMTLHADGAHWRFALPGGCVVDWWPATARCVVYGVEVAHVHDYQQLRGILARELKKG